MSKVILIFINIIGFLLFTFLNINEVAITHTAPKEIAIGQEVEVNLIINKNNFSGPGRLRLDLSQADGIKVKENMSDGSSFTFKENEVLFIWYDLPSEKSIVVTYTIIAQENISGMKKITGDFSFINDNERKQLGVPELIFKVNPELVAEEKIKENNSSTNSITTQAVETAGSIFKNTEGCAKFIWTNLSDSISEIIVKYKISNNIEIDTNFTISGVFSSEKLISEGYNSGIEIPETEYVPFKDTNELINETISQIVLDTTKDNLKKEIKIEEVKEEGVVEVKKEEVIKNIISTKKMNNNVDYKVQILAGHRIISDKQVSNQFNYNGEYDLETHNGWIKYTVGTNSKYSDARDSRNKLKNYNFPGPFVTAYNYGQRISVQEALILTSQNWIP